jgi:hypothetical protein
MILWSFQISYVGTLLGIYFFTRISSISFSAITFALASLFQFLIRVECVLESNLVPLHRVYVGSPNSWMLLLLKLNFICLISIILWYCTGLSLIVYFFRIIILVFIFHLCRFKIWFWILIFIISFSTFLPIIFIENVDLTVFNLAPNFMKFGCLAYCVSLLLLISLKTEITIQSINIFLFWILIILLLNLIIVICKALSSIGGLNKKNLILISHLLEHCRSFICFDHSFVALVYFFYIFLLAFEDLSCKSWIFIRFILVCHLVKKLEPFLFLRIEC